MELAESKLLHDLRALSRYCILVGIIVGLGSIPFGNIPLSLQTVLALVALTVGIPHGAVDHLITVPMLASMKMVAFLLSYLAVVGLSIWAILSANLLGFQLVVLMSAIHFGLGDAAFISELDSRSPKQSRFPKIPYLVASGFIPVLIPLVSNESSEALNAVNPLLVNWAGGYAPVLFALMLAVGLGAIAWMLIAKRAQEAIDLALLVTLVLVTPPLVAFAFYFGLWHALRHTGRLTLEFKKSQEQHEKGKTWRAFWSAVWAGAPALGIVLVFTVILALTTGFDLSNQFLWYLLVVIWALTVPHMALTLRLDLRALRR